MKLVVTTLLLLLSLSMQAQYQKVVTLPIDYPVNNSIVFSNESFEDDYKDNLLKNLDSLLSSDTIFVKQFFSPMNNSGSMGSILRMYYKVTFTKKKGIADGLFQIDYLYKTSSRFDGWKETAPVSVLDSLPPATIITGNYKDGEKQGVWTFSDLKGILIAQGELQGNHQVGAWLEKRREPFLNGANTRESITCYWESYYTQEGLRHGESVGYQFQVNDKVKRVEVDYQNGVKNGAETMYHPDGKLHVKGNYVEGKRNDLYQVWAENGTKILEVSFKDDLYHGQFTKWWTTGKLHYAGQYIDGNQEGEWVIYHKKTNTLLSKGNYENGRKTGVWMIYFPDRKLYRKELMKEGRWYEMESYTDADCLYEKITFDKNNRKIIEKFECE